MHSQRGWNQSLLDARVEHFHGKNWNLRTLTRSPIALMSKSVHKIERTSDFYCKICKSWLLKASFWEFYCLGPVFHGLPVFHTVVSVDFSKRLMDLMRDCSWLNHAWTGPLKIAHRGVESSIYLEIQCYGCLCRLGVKGSATFNPPQNCSRPSYDGD